MTAHNLEKIKFFLAYIAFDNNDLHIKGYNLYRADQPNNVKGGGA